MWTPPGYPVDASIALPSHSGCQSEPCNGLNASRKKMLTRNGTSGLTETSMHADDVPTLELIFPPRKSRSRIARVRISSSTA